VADRKVRAGCEARPKDWEVGRARALTGIQVVELDLTTGDGLRVALEFSPTPTDDQFHAAGGVVYVPDGEST
jgi:hypothetical protein